MAKKIHFLSGMPRACSTLLANLLAQNPRVHSTPTSPVHEIGWIARKVFQTEEAKAVTGPVMEQLFLNYVKGGTESAFDTLTNRPIVVDKCRSYVGHLDQLFKIWPNAKVIVPVRDIRGILTSLEKKRRSHPSPIIGIEEQNPANFTTIEKRVQGWLAAPPVGIAIERVYEAYTRFGNKLLFVHAEELTENPKSTMKKVWNYLEEDFDLHDFENVEQYTKEVDVGWPYGDHVIRNKVRPLQNDWNEVLGRPICDLLSQKFNWINNL